MLSARPRRISRRDGGDVLRRRDACRHTIAGHRAGIECFLTGLLIQATSASARTSTLSRGRSSSPRSCSKYANTKFHYRYTKARAHIVSADCRTSTYFSRIALALCLETHSQPPKADFGRRYAYAHYRFSYSRQNARELKEPASSRRCAPERDGLSPITRRAPPLLRKERIRRRQRRV